MTRRRPETSTRREAALFVRLPTVFWAASRACRGRGNLRAVRALAFIFCFDFYRKEIDDLAYQAHSICSCCAIIIEDCNTIILPMVEIQNATFE